jgi:hypothetical protein
MQWSKLRSLFLEHLAPELKSRVDVHSAAYRSGGRTWISFDGDEIVCVQAPGFTRQVFRHSTCADLHNGQTLELGDAIFTVLHSSIDESLDSDNPLVQAVALLDKRCGKRRIEMMATLQSEALPSFKAAILASRLVANGKPPIPVVCEHCGNALVHEWREPRRV